MNHNLGFLGEPQREHHHKACQQQQECVGNRRLKQSFHREGVCSGTGSNPLVVGVQSSKRHAHEVDKVVAGKSKCQSKGASQNDDLEDVDVGNKNQKLEDNREHHKERCHNRQRVVAHEVNPFGAHEARALGALHDQKVENGRDSQPRVDAADAAIHFFEIEREDQSGNVLHDSAGNECHRHRNQDARNDRERPRAIDVFRHISQRFAVGQQRKGSCGKCTAKQFEHDRHGRRSRQTE